MTDQLWFTAHAFNLKIHNFILMINHYHLIDSSPDGNLSEAIVFFQAQASRLIVKQAGRINHLWARRFGGTEIKTWYHYKNIYKYVYQNSVRARQASKVETYPYSTLAGKLGLVPLEIPVLEDTLLFDDSLEHTLAWLNTMPSSKDLNSVRRGLKHGSFRLPKIDSGKNPLEYDLL